MDNKTKNIIIIILSVLLFISFIFNIINFKPMMRNNMIPNHMNDMQNNRYHQRPNIQKPDNNENNQNQNNEQNVE